jgi:mannosyltransferase OCH1-like enzyme
MNFSLINNKQRIIENNKKVIEQKNKELNRDNILKNYTKLMKPFILKQTYNSIIPLHLYTCWHTKELPPLMQKNYNRLVDCNPKITFHLYDENDCRNFISEHFDEDVLHAYNSLIPCSYKSDLWRFCVLYINGGIYMDIKYNCVNGFKFISLTEKEYFVKDRPEDCVYTALISCLPKTQIMLNCINQIVENVKNKYYGKDWLYPTGPGLLGKFFSSEARKNLELYFTDTKIDDKSKEYIVFKDTIVLMYYDGYRKEQAKYQKNKYYADLWREKNIYSLQI